MIEIETNRLPTIYLYLIRCNSIESTVRAACSYDPNIANPRINVIREKLKAVNPFQASELICYTRVDTADQLSNITSCNVLLIYRILTALILTLYRILTALILTLYRILTALILTLYRILTALILTLYWILTALILTLYWILTALILTLYRILTALILTLYRILTALYIITYIGTSNVGY